MVICFDGDRTLWDLIYDYNDCCEDLKEWMTEEFGISAPMDIIKTTLMAHIKHEHKNENFHRSVFPLCIMRTFNSLYLYEKGKTPNIEYLAKAFRIGDRIYDTNPEIKPEAEYVIEKVKELYDSPVCLVTAGDHVVQNSKIYSTGLDGIFYETHITDKKDVYLFESLYDHFLDFLDVETGEYVVEVPEECIMIGDSVLNDILPALEAGWKAIYVPYTDEYDDKLIEDDNLYIAKNLCDVPNVLLKIRNDLYDSETREMP